MLLLQTNSSSHQLTAVSHAVLRYGTPNFG
nr:MAG TPA: hypothetical protein [Caudoviricetes sp.]